MKPSKLFFNAILLPVDYCMLMLAGLVVYVLRYETFLTDIRPVIFEISLLHYLRIVSLVGMLWIVIFAFAQLYSMRTAHRLIEEIGRVFLACSTGLIAIVFYIFFRHELFGSRFLVLVSWGVAIVFVSMGRVLVRMAQRAYFKKGRGVERVAIIGGDTNATRLIESLQADAASGYRVVRHIKVLNDASWRMIMHMIQSRSVDGIMFASSGYNRERIAELAQHAHEHHIDFMYVADTLEAKKRNIAISELGGMPVVHIKRTPLDGWGRIAKRIMDIAISFFLIIALSPIYLIAGLAIFFDGTRGSILVRLARIGESGASFDLYKFRSMVPNAHLLKESLSAYNERTDGPLFKIKNDPRITRVGKAMRAWSIDELPNLFNVLKGEMSLVGPRPHEPGEVGAYIGAQKRLLSIKPGVTGLAQISGRSGILFDEEARLDLLYIENWSLWHDAYILIRTPWVVLSKQNAS